MESQLAIAKKPLAAPRQAGAVSLRAQLRAKFLRAIAM